MRALILFGSKHGTVKLISEKIGDIIEGATIMNLKTSNPDLEGYDTVIIGSSLFAGAIRKEVKTFIINNEQLLKTKRLGFFISGLSQKGTPEMFEKNIPKALLNHSIKNSFVGGSFDPNRANFIERTIINKVAGKNVKSSISEEEIEAFAEAMKSE